MDDNRGQKSIQWPKKVFAILLMSVCCWSGLIGCMPFKPFTSKSAGTEYPTAGVPNPGAASVPNTGSAQDLNNTMPKSNLKPAAATESTVSRTGGLFRIWDKSGNNEAVAQIGIAWDKHINYSSDPTRGGIEVSTLAGRLYLFGANPGQPLIRPGILKLQIWDRTIRDGDQTPHLLDTITFDSASLQMLVREDIVGKGYTLFLPFLVDNKGLPTYRTDITDIHIAAEFTQVASINSPTPVGPKVTTQASLALDHSNTYEMIRQRNKKFQKNTQSNQTPEQLPFIPFQPLQPIPGQLPVPMGVPSNQPQQMPISPGNPQPQMSPQMSPQMNFNNMQMPMNQGNPQQQMQPQMQPQMNFNNSQMPMNQGNPQQQMQPQMNFNNSQMPMNPGMPQLPLTIPYDGGSQRK